MATYTSPNYAQSAPVGGSAGEAFRLVGFRFPLTITAALTTADVFNFGEVPAGFRLYGAYLEASDMDTNGSPTLAINVGDSGDADRIFAASTVGQAGTLSGALATTGLNYQYTSKTLITGAPSANAATGVAGTLDLLLWGVIEGQAS